MKFRYIGKDPIYDSDINRHSQIAANNDSFKYDGLKNVNCRTITLLHWRIKHELFCCKE